MLTKIHKVLSFIQSAWLAPYINFNTECRELAAKLPTSSPRTSTIYKLMSNAVCTYLLTHLLFQGWYPFDSCTNSSFLYDPIYFILNKWFILLKFYNDSCKYFMKLYTVENYLYVCNIYSQVRCLARRSKIHDIMWICAWQPIRNTPNGS